MDSDLDVIPFEDAALWGGNESLVDLKVVNDCIVGVVPLERVAIRDPFDGSPWFDGRGVTIEAVRAALAEGRLEATPYPGYSWTVESDWNDRRHAERIAFLVANKTTSPICIEFVDPDGTMEIDDGWHRLAAAMVRGDREIAITVGGYFRNSVARLGAICREYQRVEEPAPTVQDSAKGPVPA